MNTKSAPSVQAQTQDVVPVTGTLKEIGARAGDFVGRQGFAPYMAPLTQYELDTDLRREFYLIRREMSPWAPMASAPVGGALACIDIWCGGDDCRRTDCFWEAETQRWCYEDFESGAYRTRGVKAPVAWMAAPAKPEVL